MFGRLLLVLPIQVLASQVMILNGVEKAGFDWWVGLILAGASIVAGVEMMINNNLKRRE